MVLRDYEDVGWRGLDEVKVREEVKGEVEF